MTLRASTGWKWAVLGTVALALGIVIGASARYLPSLSTATSSIIPVAAKQKTSPRVGESAEERARAAFLAQAMATDLALTGDKNGHGVWQPPVHAFYTFCGVTPEGRYLLAKNEIGNSRFDEPWDGDRGRFLDAWNSIRCDDTSPLHQASIIQAKEQANWARAQAEMHYGSNPINSDCLMAEIHDAAHGYTDKRFDDPLYCKDGQYEKDQASQSGNTSEQK